MPPAAVGAAFVAAGVSAATAATVVTVVTGVYVGAAIGAVVGAATAAISGQSILKGALKGGLMGGVMGGVGAGVGAALSAGTNVASAGVQAPSLASSAGAINPMSPGITAVGQTAGTGTAAASNVANVAGNVASTAAQQTQPGLFTRAANFIKDSPKMGEFIGSSVKGAAKALLEQRMKQKELDALMERDKLIIDSKKVGGLADLTDTNTYVPKIENYLESPQLQPIDAGLLPVR